MRYLNVLIFCLVWCFLTMTPVVQQVSAVRITHMRHTSTHTHTHTHLQPQRDEPISNAAQGRSRARKEVNDASSGLLHLYSLYNPKTSVNDAFEDHGADSESSSTAATGVVVSATMNVELKDDAAAGSAAHGPAVTWCDMMWNPTAKGGKFFQLKDNLNYSRPRGTWTCRHILASSLGGSGTDPLNFFLEYEPCAGYSNRYSRMESIAKALRLAFKEYGLHPKTTGCQVEIHVKLTYDDTLKLRKEQKAYIPSGGTYTIQAKDECVEQVVHTYDPLVKAFKKHSVKIGKHRVLRTPWSNEADTPIKGGEPGPGQVVQSNLFD